MTRLLPLSLLLSTLALAADSTPGWPRWRGPQGDGTAPGGNPPLRWDAKTNIAWKTAIPGRGASTPIVLGDQVFILTAVDTERKASPADLPPPVAVPEGADPSSPRYKRMTKPTGTYHRFIVLALDRRTGKARWQDTAAEKVPHEGHHQTHTYAAGSPVTDGKRLYLSFGSFGTFAYSLDGKQLWKRDLGKLETRLGWGEAVTPAVHDGKVFLAHDHEGPSFLTALDAATGKTLWKVDRDEPSAWTTPVIAQHGGQTQVIVTGMRRIRSYDANTGKLIWHAPGLTLNTIPTAIVRDDVVYCMSGYKGSTAIAINLGGTGDLTGTDKILWTFSRNTPYVPSPALVGERLWFTRFNDPILTTLDIHTGKPVIDGARLGGLTSLYASPVAAAGRVYFTGRDGTTVVLKQADRFEVLATNRLEEQIDASPAIVGKQLFLRGENHVYCIEEK